MKTYSEYRKTEFDWIGQIPSHWETRPIWMMFHLGRGRVISNVEIGDNPGPYPVYSSQTENDGIMGYIDTYDFDGDHITWTTDGAKAGTVFCRTGKFNCTNVCGTLSPNNQNVNLSFFSHALNIVTSRFVRQDINPKLMNNVMGRIRVQVPQLPEQTQIAAFLDRKTRQIDELVSVKERKIELLQEQRTALINQAVTKGLDPNVEVKPSGLEWIAEMPTCTERTRLKYICEQIVDCEHKTAPTQETGFPLIRTPNIGIGHLILNGVNRVSEATYREWSRRTIPQADDLILAREAPVGNVAIIPKNLKICLGQRTVLIRPDKKKVCSMFLVYLMLGDEIQARLLGRSTGSTVHHLNITDIRNLILPQLPTLPIQHRIAEFLDRKTAQIDELISEEQRSIELLKEYRQSLISDAVTGKIDVRSEV